jgi:hypothetical protein
MLRKESPLTLMFTKGVRKTKYDDRQDFAPFHLPDDDTDYTYQVENDDCANAIRRAPKNQWVLVTAEGANEEAKLTIRNTDGSAITQKASKAGKAGGGPDSVSDGFWQALGLARELKERYEDEFDEPLEPMIKEMATSIYINWEKGGWKPLRPGEPEETAAGQAPDPNEMVNAVTLKKVEEALGKVVIADNIREQIDTLIENGMTEATAIKTLDYLNSLPAKDQQEALPWEVDDDG